MTSFMEFMIYLFTWKPKSHDILMLFFVCVSKKMVNNPVTLQNWLYVDSLKGCHSLQTNFVSPQEEEAEEEQEEVRREDASKASYFW